MSDLLNHVITIPTTEWVGAMADFIITIIATLAALAGALYTMWRSIGRPHVEKVETQVSANTQIIRETLEGLKLDNIQIKSQLVNLDHNMGQISNSIAAMQERIIKHAEEITDLNERVRFLEQREMATPTYAARNKSKVKQNTEEDNTTSR
jgi:septal ring factor EnvC (AmiA/AmiB activator)